MKTSTLCVRHPHGSDPHGAVAPPIYQTATFRQPTATEFGEYDYTRTANPTRTLLEQQLAALESGRFAAAYASGLAALTALTRLVNQGEEIVAGDDLYGGTVRLLEQVLPRYGVAVRYADAADPDSVRRELTPRTRLILVETPTNPLLRVADVRALSELARGAGALLAVDNSMLSPCLQKPLKLGADVVLHSATKFLGGHSDVTAGALVTDDEELHRRLCFQQNAEGSGLSPFESWLLLRGIKTLSLRVERQCSTALRVAEFLSGRPEVKRVFYPGLQGHPGRDVHRGQARGDGAVLSFATGDAELSRRVVESVRLFDIAVSFGSVHSSISLPCRMSHASIPPSARERLAPPPDLVRVSVGIEDAEDLLADLEQAFNVARPRERKTEAVAYVGA
ncbi:MAG: PLP-dependent transferase [Acidobacteria bacterium]|nr:PLP-dependent transferase [Acidobacteriota bacterium]